MTSTTYTAVTFAPVQGFIEKSRKLRDLYGSSFLLSYLAKAICNAAKDQNMTVISPALINVTQGTPNQIIIKGNFTKNDAKAALSKSWNYICDTVKQYIEDQLPDFQDQFHWQRNWNYTKSHTWEFFWEQSQVSIEDVRKRLSESKRERDWTGINWQGESSTLSGFDAVAWYGMADKTHPLNHSIPEQTRLIQQFYQQLDDKVQGGILDKTEQLSIPELIKRLITLPDIANLLNNLTPEEIPSVEYPRSFVDLNRKEQSLYTGWFQGDGDNIGKYLADQSRQLEEDIALEKFSRAMMNWGRDLKYYLPPLADPVPKVPERRLPQPLLNKDGRIIYAGGDDFLGVLYRVPPQDKLTAKECLDWLFRFNNNIWSQHKVTITVSIGFVWAAPNIPQRDVLQHCRETEKLAKDNGRDRLAIRILFNSGNHLDWHCPWWFLQKILEDYQDREGKQNWTHFYNDVAVLETRHAFSKDSDQVAKALFNIYFPHCFEDLKRNMLPNNKEYQTPILPDSEPETLNDWVRNLAKVGFQIYA
ncbi:MULTISPECIES: type III-B CRISPR-associated protein Cas10/Cmr2 [unclassified Synechocystis]|uniref:Cas10/Cmr2 second palm domain-containing protein n=1 Tax=unclassified Synechocystis TaxID=2640012 RepID=UPI0004156092|nr:MULTISPECIES: type III-B CRISPR-associated protein Cas10/Cmr2 [unclassified Synechocystis]AIE73551.1 hypothetical protein D082_10230 [Synechocystis sp. PCC 6714]MCT0254114.1 hypothetical protein [Synechocystis sp. CS-94]